MTINLSDNSPRISYTVAQGATQTTFAVPFEFFDDADLNVYVDGTLKSITTHYTVSGGSGTTGSVGISVTGISGGSTVIITRDIALARTTDFPTSGPFDVATLNTELDRFTAQLADQKDENDRSVRLADDDAAVSMTLPLKANRIGKTLAFNASTGAAEAGPSVAGVTTVAAMAADIATLADIEDGTTATDAISGLAAIKTNVTTAAGIAGNITTVAGIQANVTTVAGIQANVTTVAGIASNVTTVAGIASNVTSVAGNATNINTVAGNNTNINTVAGINSSITTVAGIASNVTTVAGISSDVTTLANALSATTTYAVTVASVGGSNVFVLDGSNNPAIQLDRGNTYIFDQSDSSNAGHTLAFKNGSSSYTTGVTTTGTAGQAGAKTTIIVDAAAPSSGLLYYCVAHGNAMGNSITTVTSNFAVVASSIANINTVAGIQANVTSVASNSSNINAVASNSSNINAAVSNASNINAAVSNASNINSAVSNATNINTVASNITGVNSFAERYRVDSSDPTSSLNGGDLAFNTSANQLKFYNGSAWVAISPGLSSVSADSAPQLGGNLNVGSSSIVSSSNGNIAITPNGSGKVVIDGLSHPTSDGSAGQFLKTDGSGNLAFQTVATSLSGDSSPQLGGDLDVNSNDILMGTQSLKFGTSKWEIVLDNTNNTLDFKYNGTVVFSLASNGAAISADDITAFGTP